LLDQHRIGALLLMGGKGLRFGSDIPKQFHRLSGKPIYQVTLEIFLEVGFFDEIVLSCHPDWFDRVQQELAKMKALIPIQLVVGGQTRQASSFKGLLGFQTPPSIVLIHDSVRPFVSADILINNARLAITHGAVDTCIPSTDTLVHSEDRISIKSIPHREHFYRGQTPQSFSYSLILQAHRETSHKDASDDCRLMIERGHKVFLAQGDEQNIKITSELDLFLAEQLFRLRRMKASSTQSSLAGKRYVVIGGTGGIGSAISKELDQKGASVTPLSRTTPLKLDVQNRDSIEEVFAKMGELDGLIYAAGYLCVAPLSKLTVSQIEQTLDVNLKGMILCIKAAKLKANAHLITIASSSFTKGRKDASVYSCAKAGVVNFTQALAEERPDLFVHTVIPQRTRTQMRLSNFPDEDPDELLSPKQVADTVLQLLMDTSSTGMIVEVRKDSSKNSVPSLHVV